MKNRLYIVVIAAGLFSGCSKNQSRTNRLDGEWSLAYWEVRSGGNLVQSIHYVGTFDFQGKDPDKDDFCPYSYQSADNETQVTGAYRFEHKGQELLLREMSGNGAERSIRYKVLKFKCDFIQIETTDSLHHTLTLVRS